MGLDTYAAYNKENYPPIPSEEFKNFDYLCGGLFSGGGSSFRGKMYSEFIQAISGVSLYQEVMPPEQVKVVTLALHNAIFVHDEGYKGTYFVSNEEIYSLFCWFNTVLKHEGVVLGWW